MSCLDLVDAGLALRDLDARTPPERDLYARARVIWRHERDGIGRARERTPHSTRYVSDSMAMVLAPPPTAHPSPAPQSPRTRGSGGEAR